MSTDLLVVGLGDGVGLQNLNLNFTKPKTRNL